MHALTPKILERHLVRKTKAQKDAFITLLREHYPALRQETGGPMKSSNLILGDLETAEVVLTAHYDTVALSLLPNIIMPYRKGLKFAYSMLAVLPYVAAMLLTYGAVDTVSGSMEAGLLAGLVVYYGLYFGKFYAGMPNPSNYNDNTSGVLTLLSVYEAMSPEQRKKTAFVFFDNEEYGCVGSKWFYKQHKAVMDGKLLINFDCVGDGDHFLLVESTDMPEKWAAALRQAFQAEPGHTVVFDSAKKANHSSDHKHFKHFLSVLAVHDHPRLGLSAGRIHTPKDTVLEEENVDYLTRAVLRFI